jgi:fermentation-respiration switch protein FrsA (DUF1100 family)
MEEQAIESSYIFFPERGLLMTPKNAGLNYEDVYFKTDDKLRLHGWYIPNPGSDRVLLFFHGNGGNISHRVENLKLLHALGLNIFIFDYRGYGQSEGVASENGTYRDAEAALSYLTSAKGVSLSRIVLFGRSLGGAVAIDLACRHSFPAIILESTFTSFADLLRPFVPSVAEAINEKFNSLKKIGQISAPLLFFHGNRDELVAYDNGKELFAAANEPKEFYTIEGAGHNDTYYFGGEPYWRKIKEFIDKNL